MERRWADVCVGDLIRLCCNEIIPADMVLLHSSDPNGVCHIETANLDGETNLKQRQVVRDLPQQVSGQSIHFIIFKTGEIKYERSFAKKGQSFFVLKSVKICHL